MVMDLMPSTKVDQTHKKVPAALIKKSSVQDCVHKTSREVSHSSEGVFLDLEILIVSFCSNLQVVD